MGQTRTWHPFSWEDYPAVQSVDYPDRQVFSSILKQLKTALPLVNPQKINHLRKLIYQASQGKAFILQGGDCYELFADCQPSQIESKLNMLLQMSRVLRRGVRKPVIPIGRIAGQYAKPRTVLTETQGNITLPAYRGDMINSPEFTKEKRLPDPQRMLKVYQCASLTLSYLQASSPAEFFTSHEALHLPYEAALTREVTPDFFYNLSTHFPWVGVRTLQLNSAHVEYLRGIENPVAIKIGPDLAVDELLEIIRVLNPKNKLGKLTLIHRFGKKAIEEKLPLLLEKLKKNKIRVALMCDPMHGNTYMTSHGFKTRCFETILGEWHEAVKIHRQYAVPLAGIHFEMTTENVTECVGGEGGIKEEDLKTTTYTSLVDPRLNVQQALKLASTVVEYHQKRRVYSQQLSCRCGAKRSEYRSLQVVNEDASEVCNKTENSSAKSIRHGK